MVLYKTHPHDSNQALIINLDRLVFMRKFDMTNGYTAISFSDGSTIYLPLDEFDKITKVLHWRLWKAELE